MEMYTCSICNEEFDGSDIYEYRGAYACEEHFDVMQGQREFQRQEIIKEEDSKTKVFKGLDLGDNVIGKANRELLKGHIEVASKESGRLKDYEGRN